MGKVSQTKVYILNGKQTTDKYVPTVFDYDAYGRVILQRGNHHVNALNNDNLIPKNNYNLQMTTVKK